MLIIFCIFASITFAGSTLFGKGTWVTGSLTVVVPKLPLLNAGVGTVHVVVAAVRIYFRSSLKKKNSFSRSRLKRVPGMMIGPPILKPGLFHRSFGFPTVAALKVYAASLSLRQYSYTMP